MSEQAISLEQFAGALAAAEEGQPENPEHESEEQAAAAAEGQPDANAEAEGAEEQSEEQEAEAEQEAQPAADADPDPVVKWTTANGETFEVKTSELRNGYMRDADYRQKTQALAEERRQVEQTITQKFQEAEAYAADLAQLHALQSQMQQYEALDWNAIEAQDPAQAASLWRQYQQLKDKGQQLAAGYQSKRVQIEQQRAQQFQQATTEALEHLRKVVPNFGEQTLKELREYGLKAGFKPEELAQVADKRHFEVLWKAAQWEALQAKKPEVANKVKALPPKTTKPGASAPPPTAIEKAQQQFRKSRDVRSFAKLLELSDK